jgi:predicted dehydrogenase
VRANDIASPAAEHARVALDALQAGKDVFAETPLALSLDDAAALAAIESAEAGSAVDVDNSDAARPAAVNHPTAR